MTWARLDDGYYGHPKIRRALSKEPAAVALFSLTLSWSAANESDGHVPDDVMEMLLPPARKRQRALQVLDEVGLVHRNGESGGYVIHDFLDYNLSREDIESRREADRRRKDSARKGSP